MQQTYQLCNSHLQPITNICIENHLCEDRRLCVVCLFQSHKGIDQDNTPLFDRLYLLLNEKFTLLKNENLKLYFSIIEKCQNQVNEYFSKLKNQLANLISQKEANNSIIYCLKEKLAQVPLGEFSRSEYNLMMDIIKKNKIENLAYEQNALINLCELQIQKLETVCQKYFEELCVLAISKNIETLEDDVQMEEEILFGVKHGNFYYVKSDGSKDFARNYKFGMKTGQWFDYLGYDQKFMKKIYKKKFYQLGIDQGLNKGKVEKNLLIKNEEWIESTGKWSLQGQYDQYGQKQGTWTETINTYDSKCQVTFTGEYKNGQRTGDWAIIYETNRIGGGAYNYNGQKTRNWIDLFENFKDYCQVTYTGEYDQDVRIGHWKTMYQNIIIGGGIYDKNGMKQGFWKDLHPDFYESRQVIYSGEYENGLRVGIWMIHNEKSEIGGGTFNKKGNKIGVWVDLHKSYYQYELYPISFSQVTETGEYENGIKIGRWSIIYENGNLQKIVGGGMYNQRGEKTDVWTGIHERFHHNCQMVFTGQYKNGVRVDEWSFQYQKEQKLFLLGILGLGVHMIKEVQKSEIGFVLTKSFQSLYFFLDSYRQVYFCGTYNKGVKVGEWITLFVDKKIDKKIGKKIGGGNYNLKGIKIGQWIDLHQEFSDQRIVTFQGLYQDGIRVSIWKTYYYSAEVYHFYLNSGGGKYDKRGIKKDRWIDIHENFFKLCQVTHAGKYYKGNRVGEWQTFFGKDLIGGGIYNEGGMKNGYWVDLHDEFHSWRYEIILKEYKNGIQEGQSLQKKIKPK